MLCRGIEERIARKSMTKSYKHLITLSTFEDRLNYLKLSGVVGESTFGVDRYLNQALYHSKEWRDLRNYIIARDDGCDLAMPDYGIYDNIYIHHINPIREEDIERRSSKIMDPNNLVCVSFETHNFIHFGYQPRTHRDPVVRYPNDTIPWIGGEI